MVFDFEVIAGFVVAAPPFAGDSFGAGGVAELVKVTTVAEEDGAAVAVVRGRDHDFHFHGIQKLKRAGREVLSAEC